MTTTPATARVRPATAFFSSFSLRKIAAATAVSSGNRAVTMAAWEAWVSVSALASNTKYRHGSQKAMKTSAAQSPLAARKPPRRRHSNANTSDARAMRQKTTSSGE